MNALPFRHLCIISCIYFSFNRALASQPHIDTPYNETLVIIAYPLMAAGLLFVITSFLKLGFFGTWHGEKELLYEKIVQLLFIIYLGNKYMRDLEIEIQICLFMYSLL